MRRLGLVVLAAVCVFAAVGYAMWSGFGPIPDPEGCTATVGGRTVTLSTEQAENAALIAAVSVQRGMPARAASIALATAFQESKLRNLDHGDRDSVGVFQQRPSQGWGTARQIQDVPYAANKFYDELEKIDGYQQMRITEAAQRVQRSGYPEAYQAHAADARALASALTGYSPAAFSCVVHDSTGGVRTQRAGPSGLTPRAAAVRRSLVGVFGSLPFGGRPAGVSTGQVEGSSHDHGRALDVLVRPVGEPSRRRGWAIASYLVAHAARLQVAHVIFDARIWTAGARSESGWRVYHPGTTSGDRAVLEHRDRVHVDVVAGG
jgi:hypothetical protein